MNIFCNGSPIALHSGATIQTLIELLAIEPKGTAVALNDDLVVKSIWANQTLQDGDRITIIRAAQGG